MPSVLAPKSRRRQNASCDRCRHSKRRCLVLPSEEGEHGIACTNCTRLGYLCTFAFAKACKNSGQKISPANFRLVQPPPSEWFELGSSEVEFPGLVQPQSNSLANSHDGNPLSEPQVEMDFDEFLEFNSEHFPDQFDFVTTPEITQFPLAQPTDHEAHLLLQDVPLIIEAGKSQVRPGHNSIVGRSLNSPVHLLSSSWEAVLLTEHFARIYQTITAGTASIFLDYDCNLYTGRYRYRFDFAIPSQSHDPSFTALSVVPHDPATVPSTSRTSSFEIVNTSPSQPHTASSRLSTQLPGMHETTRTITILGAVRFLDHFGDLYGNRLSPDSKSQSEEALKEVLRTFSFQWLATINSAPKSRVSNSAYAAFAPSTSQQPSQPSLAFVDTWVRARSLIKNAQSVNSFCVVYATLLFDTIIVPGEAVSGLEEDVVMHEFLDTVFLKLAHLERLVEKYCDNLGATSEHGALMESSLSIVRWFAYLRDTVVALMTDRSCRLQEARSHIKVSSISGLASLVQPAENFGSLDEASLARICRRAIPETFSVWRKIVGLRDITTKQCEDFRGSSQKRVSALASITAAVTGFEKCFRPFMNYCRDNFRELSMALRRFVVFLVLFWDLGVLRLAEMLKILVLEDTNPANQHLFIQMQKYQWESAISMAYTVECVLNLPTAEGFKPFSGLDPEVPVTASHVTPTIVVLALHEAIEQIIQAKLSSGSNLAPDGVWDRSLGILMKGLVALGVTVGGSRTATVSMQTLMHAHADILSECWLG